jgi:glycosyltransferase involved in cell wall biosynthesis
VTAPALPTVSVVIPVRDDAVALEACLALLARQTVRPAEVVVVDNGSSDGSAGVAAAWGARVVPEERTGIPAAASTGYDHAVGDVIARLDADSRPGPRWVERIATRMAHEPGLDAVTGTGRFVDLPAGVAAVASAGYLGSYYVLCHLALGHTALWGSSMAVRRSTWLAVRSDVCRDDAEVHDDLDLAFALGPGRRIRFDRGLRVGVSARSLRGRAQRRRRLDRAWRTLRRNWRRMPPWERWRARLARSVAGRPAGPLGSRMPRPERTMRAGAAAPPPSTDARRCP